MSEEKEAAEQEDGKVDATSASEEVEASQEKSTQEEGAAEETAVEEEKKEPEKKFTDEDMKKARESFQHETRKEREARIRAEERAAVYQELAAGKKPNAEATETEQPAEPKELQKPKRPVEADFQTREEFEKAQDKYEDDSYNYRRSLEQKQAEEQTAAQQRTSAIDKHVKAGIEKYPDFEEKVIHGKTPATQVMMDAIIRRENGHDVAYFLATNQSEASRIRGLHPVDQVAEITAISLKLKQPEKAAPAQEQKKETTKTPKPAAQVGGRAKASTNTSLEGKSQEERMRLLEETSRKNRLSGKWRSTGVIG